MQSVYLFGSLTIFAKANGGSHLEVADTFWKEMKATLKVTPIRQMQKLSKNHLFDYR